ncbi:MAG: hypothetical protein ACFB2X_15320 [Rivularia sp. (in: cyanobacteria)]
MKYANLLSLSLVVFTLFGCNKAPLASQTNNTVEASNTSQKENDSAQKVATKVKTSTRYQTQNSDSQKVATNVKASTRYQKENSSDKSETITQGKESKTGKLIGAAFDCDNDGQADDSRIDYDGDGIPDDCLVVDEDEIEPIIDESSYETVMNSLNLLSGDCKETEKIQGNIKYTICKLGGKPVKASESHNELGDGIGFWFLEGRVIAAQRFHNGELFVFDYDGKLSSMFAENQKTGKIEKLASIPDEDRKSAEKYLYNGYQNIFKVFNL